MQRGFAAMAPLDVIVTSLVLTQPGDLAALAATMLALEVRHAWVCTLRLAHVMPACQ